MALLPRLCVVLGGWRRCFSDHRTYRRAQEHAIALLVCLGRRTISRSICVLGRQFRNWTSEYRLFSKCKWKPHALFDVVLEQIPELLSPGHPLVVVLDDTTRKKTGKRICAAKVLRDHLNIFISMKDQAAELLRRVAESYGDQKDVSRQAAAEQARARRDHDLALGVPEVGRLLVAHAYLP